jgi:hypothetical protein
MENYLWQALALAFLFSAGLIVYVVHHRRQALRVHDAEAAVNGFLLTRYASLPAGIRINCSNDWNWPVLVYFLHPVTGVLQRLQFSFAAAPASLLLISEDSLVR